MVLIQKTMAKEKVSQETLLLIVELLVGEEVRTAIAKKDGIIGVEIMRLQNLEAEAPTSPKEEDTPIG